VGGWSEGCVCVLWFGVGGGVVWGGGGVSTCTQINITAAELHTTVSLQMSFLKNLIIVLCNILIPFSGSFVVYLSDPVKHYA